jgi:hypothetical protein
MQATRQPARPEAVGHGSVLIAIVWKPLHEATTNENIENLAYVVAKSRVHGLVRALRGL